MALVRVIGRNLLRAVERELLRTAVGLPMCSYSVSYLDLPGKQNCFWKLMQFDRSEIIFHRTFSRRVKAVHDSSSSSDSDSDSDSDSESDDNRLKGESKFWKKKMHTFHYIMDINKDGTVSWDDFDMMAKKFIKLGNLTENQQAAFQDALKCVWEQQWGSIDPYSFVSQEDYLLSMTHVVNDSDLRKKIHVSLPYFFKAVDHDGSGEISIEEYKLFFRCLGLSEKAATESFKVIDVNKDGLLSLKEFVNLGREFFLSEDETRPSKLFWGPLYN